MTELPTETVNAAQARVSDILKTNGKENRPLRDLPSSMDGGPHGAQIAVDNSGTGPLVATSAVRRVPPIPRRTRSDAGKPREKKAVAPEGKLSKEQISRLEGLRAQVTVAQMDYERARAAYQAFLEEITAQ